MMTDRRVEFLSRLLAGLEFTLLGMEGTRVEYMTLREATYLPMARMITDQLDELALWQESPDARRVVIDFLARAMESPENE